MDYEASPPPCPGMPESATAGAPDPPPLFHERGTGGRLKKGYFAQNPLPFPLFYKEPFHSFTFLQMNPCPFIIFTNKPFHHKSIISVIPLHFSRVAPMFSKITTKPLPLKNIYKKALEPRSIPKPLCNLSFHAPNDLRST